MKPARSLFGVLSAALGWVVCLAPARSAAAQETAVWDTLDMASRFELKTAMIPMRDGARLYTEIYLPKISGSPLPFLMERTPYDARNGLTLPVEAAERGFSTRLHDHE